MKKIVLSLVHCVIVTIKKKDLICSNPVLSPLTKVAGFRKSIRNFKTHLK